MTDPDPLADLAAQLAELRGQLARSQGEIGVLRERLEASTGQTAMLRLEVKQLREELAEAIEKRQLKPPPAPWWCVGQDEGQEMLAELARVGRYVPAAALPGLRGPAPPLLAGPHGGGLGAEHPAGRVDPRLRRRGQPGPAGCPDLA